MTMITLGRFIRTRTMLAGGLLAIATAAAGVTAAGPALAASASAASRPVVLVSCGGVGQVRPARYDGTGCMPSNELVAGLTWTSWRSAAFGSGVLKVNDCTPTCAQGRYVKYPILVVLWRARPWPGHPGRAYFSQLTCFLIISSLRKWGVVVRSGGQFTVPVDTASAASITARPGTIFRSPRLPRDPLPVPKLVAPAAKVNALPPLSA